MSDKLELTGFFKGGFGVVPKQLMRADDINSSTKLVLCYLLSYTGTGMECFPKISTIATELKISTRTIIRCIKSAIEKKYITKRLFDSGNGNGKNNVYTLLFMADYPRKEGDKMSPTKTEGDITANIGDKIDTKQVTLGKSNSNSISNKKKNNKKPIPFYTDLDETKKNEVHRLKDKIWEFLKMEDPKLGKMDRRPVTPRERDKWNIIALQDIGECIQSVGARRTYASFMCMINIDEKGNKFWWDNFRSTKSLSEMVRQFNGQKHEDREYYFEQYDSLQVTK